jgi:hypothetical protein
MDGKRQYGRKLYNRQLILVRLVLPPAGKGPRRLCLHVPSLTAVPAKETVPRLRPQRTAKVSSASGGTLGHRHTARLCRFAVDAASCAKENGKRPTRCAEKGR